MYKEFEEFEKRIKKERSKILKASRQEIFDQCNEVYQDISMTELRLLWYLRQFTQLSTNYCLDFAKYVYRAKLSADKKIEEEKNIGIDKS